MLVNQFMGRTIYDTYEERRARFLAAEKRSPARPKWPRMMSSKSVNCADLWRLEENASFESFLNSFIEVLSQKDERKKVILNDRLGITGEIPPLSDLSERIGVAKARVYQIERKMKDRFEREMYCCIVPRFMDMPAFASVMQKGGGAASYKEALYDALFGMFELSAREKGLALNLAKFLKNALPCDVSFIGEMQVVYDVSSPCTPCRKTEKKLKQMFTEESSVWEWREAAIKMREACVGCPAKTEMEAFSNGFVLRKAGQISGVRYQTGQLICKQNTSTLKKKMIEEYLDEIGHAIYFDDLLEDIIKRNPSELFTRSILTLLLKDMEHVFRWGSGLYIHGNHINVPRSQITKIEETALRRLRGGASMIMSRDLFVKNKIACEKAGILSPQALYSCLLISNNKELSFSRYPRIQLKGKSGAGDA